MKKYAFLICLGFFGCTTAQLAETGSVITDLTTDAQAGLIVYADAQTALSAAQQAMGSHGLSVNNAVAYANAEASAANTSGLGNAVNTVVSDVSSQYAALKLQGASDAAASTAVTQTLTTAQTTIPVPATTP